MSERKREKSRSTKEWRYTKVSEETRGKRTRICFRLVTRLPERQGRERLLTVHEEVVIM